MTRELTEENHEKGRTHQGLYMLPPNKGGQQASHLRRKLLEICRIVKMLRATNINFVLGFGPIIWEEQYRIRELSLGNVAYFKWQMNLRQ